MAEIELSILGRQRLSHRLSPEQLEAEVPVWETARNPMQGKIHWQFTAEDARIKLRHLYPKQQQAQ